MPPPKKKAAGKVGKPPLAPKARSDKAVEGAEPADGPSAERLALGARLRRFRRDLGWTLEEASRVTGVGRSTLSKIENGQISPTFDLLRRLTMRMRVDLVDLFSAETNQEPRGRRSLTLKGNGKRLSTPTYTHELLAADVAQKKMLPFKSRITARSVDEFSNWTRHDGEEIMIVLSGSIEVHTEYYRPVTLAEGDAIYFDSQMGHLAISVGDEDAHVFWVCSIDVFKEEVRRVNFGTPPTLEDRRDHQG